MIVNDGTEYTPGLIGERFSTPGSPVRSMLIRRARLGSLESYFMRLPVQLLNTTIIVVGALWLTGCPPHGDDGHGTPKLVERDDRPRVLQVNFDDPIASASIPDPVALTAAKNEVVSFTVQVSGIPHNSEHDPITLRLSPLKWGEGKQPDDQIDARLYTAYQLVPMPVDLNRAGFVRHTGREPASDHRLPKALPRALLPVALTNDGQINVTVLRDANDPRNPAGRAAVAGSPAMLWIDIPVPLAAKPGDYQGSCELLDGRHVLSTLAIKVRVHDFVIPDERHLSLVGRCEWSSLRRLYPALFETLQPHLLNRKDPKLAAPLHVIDQLVALGQQHRLQVVVPQLQPIVKWPTNAPPRITWDDYDSVTLPWLKGDAFADKLPLGYWPLPATPYLESFDDRSRMQYWAAVATHFDQLDLLKSTAVTIENTSPGRVSAVDSFRLSDEAARILASHPHIRVDVPMEDEQVQFAGPSNPRLIEESMLDRLVTAGPGLVSSVPSGEWPKGLAHPAHWLRTDLPGLVPYVGAGGDERDVRLWAWLAFRRQAELIQWPNTLPSYDNPDQPADPSEVTWFYPGQWFGLNEPVPTVQIKWLRRAEQDYEYLFLAKLRGEVINALVMASLITKPVEIPLTEDPDPTYALMCGTSDLSAWSAVKGLLAESILLRTPGQPPDEDKRIDLNGRTLQWMEPQERPLMVGRTTSWGWSSNPAPGRWVDFRLGLDIYNAAGQRLIGKLQWNSAPSAWQFNPRPVEIPPNRAINTFNVRRLDVEAGVNLEQVTAESRQPIELLFNNDLTGRQSTLKVVVPVAISDRRGPGPLAIDGSLEDWNEKADAIQDGPLVRMLNRPALQKLQLQYASTPTQIFSGWANDNFYLAFKVNGVQPSSGGAERSFVDFQVRRAWGEDVCEVSVQAVYADGFAGPVLHLTCKPRGQLQVERKMDRKLSAVPMEAVVGQALRYAATTETKEGGAIWRAELAIPWNAMNDERHQNVRPTLLRFNFAQHKNATGESASWAGPIDFGGDDNFMGLLYLRDPANPSGRGAGGQP